MKLSSSCSVKKTFSFGRFRVFRVIGSFFVEGCLLFNTLKMVKEA